MLVSISCLFYGGREAQVTVYCRNIWRARVFWPLGDFFYFLFSCTLFNYCFIYHPSDSTVSEDAEIRVAIEIPFRKNSAE